MAIMRQFKPGQLQTGSLYPISASYALTASYALAAGIDTGSLVTTASFNAFTASYTTGSFTGSFRGDGSQLTGIVSSKWTGSNPISRQSDVEITGSLRVQGSITGSLFGTASWATNAQTASYVNPLNQNVIITGSVYLATPGVASVYFSGSAAASQLVWNDTDGTLDLGLKGGNVTLQVGQEQVLRVVNKTATNINLLEANYQAVRVTGAQGQRLKVDLAQATNDVLSAETIGLVTETINNNQEGFITTSGLVRGINTTGTLQGETWADGDIVYLSPTTAGNITNIKPTAPNHLIIIGFVVSAHITQGSIFVKIDNGYELDELHNVNITTGSLTAGQLLVRSGSNATGVWINTNQLTGSYGLTGSLTATSFTGSLSGTASSATSASYAVSSSLANTASYYEETDPVFTAISGSFVTTSSFNTFTSSIQGQVNSLTAATSSYTLNSVTASMLAPYVLTLQTASMTVLSASYAATASFVTSSNVVGTVTSASYALTASYLEGGVTIDTGSLVTTASFNAFTSSYATGSFTGSFTGDGSGLTGVGAAEYIRRSDYTGSADPNVNLLYLGQAPAGSSEAATVWNIARLSISSSGDTLTQSTSSAAWTNRYSYTYL
jgi:hypothetical protein